MKHIIYSKKIKNDILLTILSDIHYSKDFDMTWLNQCLKNLKIDAPDAIMIIGDLVDECNINNKDINNLLDYFHNLSKIAPVFITLGNHDITYKIKRKKWKKVEDKDNFWLTSLEKFCNNEENIHIIINESLDYNLKGNRITISTLVMNNEYFLEQKENKLEHKNTFLKYFNPIFKKNTYNIHLEHSPLRIMNKNIRKDLGITNLDLTLSGHAHNGLIATVPFNNVFKRNIFSFIGNIIFSTSSFILPKNCGLVGIKGHKLKLFTSNCRGRIDFKDGSIGFISNAVTTISKTSPKILEKFNNESFYPKEQYISIKKQS